MAWFSRYMLTIDNLFHAALPAKDSHHSGDNATILSPGDIGPVRSEPDFCRWNEIVRTGGWTYPKNVTAPRVEMAKMFVRI